MVTPTNILIQMAIYVNREIHWQRKIFSYAAALRASNGRLPFTKLDIGSPPNTLDDLSAAQKT